MLEDVIECSQLKYVLKSGWYDSCVWWMCQWWTLDLYVKIAKARTTPSNQKSDNDGIFSAVGISNQCTT